MYLIFKRQNMISMYQLSGRTVDFWYGPVNVKCLHAKTTYSPFVEWVILYRSSKSSIPIIWFKPHSYTNFIISQLISKRCASKYFSTVKNFPLLCCFWEIKSQKSGGRQNSLCIILSSFTPMIDFPLCPPWFSLSFLQITMSPLNCYST